MNRRNLIKTITTWSALVSTGLMMPKRKLIEDQIGDRINSHKIKLSLNAYSFNDLLREGSIDLFDLVDFCSQQGFDAIDATGYYFPDYPEVPSDEYIFEFKRYAFRKGLAISGTGIRNEFVEPDANKRRQDVLMIKRWIGAASKMGAPVLRIFTGHFEAPSYSREEILEWMVKDIRECVTYGKENGVMVAVQNHNSFIKTAEQTHDLIQRIDMDWFGLILDTGSYRSGDPYDEIKSVISEAVSWQLKEFIYIGNEAREIDLVKIYSIIRAAGYRGYVPIETLGPGNPYSKVSEFLNRVKIAFELNTISE